MYFHIHIHDMRPSESKWDDVENTISSLGGIRAGGRKKEPKGRWRKASG